MTTSSPAATLDPRKALAFVRRTWTEQVLPALTEYVTIPAKSPMFDARWREHGHLDRAVALLEGWSRARPLEGLAVEVVRLPGRTPVILMEVPGSRDETVLLYGHCDKQPEMIGWADGLGPWTPVRRGDRLFGRGVGDDGYATFSALTALQALQEQRVPHARCVVLIEACEESGSYDLPAYVEALAGRIGDPGLVVCLDSGCGNYDQLWGTTSLRGIVNGVLTVQVLTEGVHSGASSGIVPSSFRIARALLSRLEDERTGEIRLADLHVEIPRERREQARAVAGVLGDEVWSKYPYAPGMSPLTTDPVAALLANTWEPALAITGAAGLPLPADGGNVMRPSTALKLSLRLPPTVDAGVAARRVKETLEAEPPHGARVHFEVEAPGNGWNAPATSDWLLAAVQSASQAFFGKPAMFQGIGGSIPFMAMLGERYPRAQFLITGVMGPGSNAHGPNEFLDLPTAERVTACVAQVIADHDRAG
jgi:acetylornithine deacetylase/succinyl-diaminopimelate desuccinylase-like protein